MTKIFFSYKCAVRILYRLFIQKASRNVCKIMFCLYGTICWGKSDDWNLNKKIFFFYYRIFKSIYKHNKIKLFLVFFSFVDYIIIHYLYTIYSFNLFIIILYLQMRGVDYIFTESFFEALDVYTTICMITTNITSSTLTHISIIIPYLVKYLIGYCHFYYQLGYGLIFYIYFFRRYRAKKKNNWKTFYGNSVLNWLFFNILVFNKGLFNTIYFIYIKVILIKIIQITKFYSIRFITSNYQYNKIKTLILANKSNVAFFNWLPLFKRSSYISFATFLKRFTKRK